MLEYILRCSNSRFPKFLRYVDFPVSTISGRPSLSISMKEHKDLEEDFCLTSEYPTPRDKEPLLEPAPP